MGTVVDGWIRGLGTGGRPHEHDGKRLLSEVGIAAPEGILVEPDSHHEVRRQLGQLSQTGHFAAKVCSPDILHKTEKEGVVLDLETDELPPAVEALLTRFPGSPVLVERMVPFSGPEIIVGALYDLTFGPAVMAGAGGIFTELYGDVAFRLAPCSRVEAVRMLGELTVFPALTGFRGIGSDIEALAGLIESVAELAGALMEEGRQLDVNPVVWDGSKWVALDVKIVL